MMHLLHLSRLPIIILISLLPCALADHQTLTLHLPPNLPPLAPSINALLVDTAFTRTAPLTRANTFVFRNLTQPGSYLLDIGCRDWDFAPMVAHVREGAGIEVVRKGGGELKRMEDGGWEARLVKPRQGWEDRGGCELSSYWDQERDAVEQTLMNDSFTAEFTQESDDPDCGIGLWICGRDALFIGKQYVCRSLFSPLLLFAHLDVIPFLFIRPSLLSIHLSSHALSTKSFLLQWTQKPGRNSRSSKRRASSTRARRAGTRCRTSTWRPGWRARRRALVAPAIVAAGEETGRGGVREGRREGEDEI